MATFKKNFFVCEVCGKEEQGGKEYFNLPENWKSTYFNNLGGFDNKQRDYCSEKCFTEDLDKALNEERERRLESFRL